MPSERDARIVHGITISCQTSGKEWGSDGLPRELDDLQSLGVNWISFHPYASVRADGSVKWKPVDPNDPPAYLARPIRDAHARGISVMVIPHLAYWGSPWSWRGEIQFTDGPALDRFFTEYGKWMSELAHALHEADAFCVGNEMKALSMHEAKWRAVIAGVRRETSAHLVYGAHWSEYQDVRFWDALDAVGVQAYFPLCDSVFPSERELESGWSSILGDLRRVHEHTGKPVVFTELGYNESLDAAREPWGYRVTRGAANGAARELQERCLKVALREIAREQEWLRGAFLWKWFIGPAPGENFMLNTESLRCVIQDAWLPNPR